MHNVSVQICDGYNSGLVNYRRPVLAFEIASDTFDAFFNSPVGYRAQFLKEPNIGQAANGWLLGRFIGKLIQSASGRAEPCTRQIEISLIGASTKIWVHEDDFPFSDLTEDLAVTAWVAAAKGRLEKRGGVCVRPKDLRLRLKGPSLMQPATKSFLAIRLVVGSKSRDMAFLEKVNFR